MKKKPIILILVILTALGGYGHQKSWWGDKKQVAAQQQEIATAKRGTIEQIITSQGKLEPKEYVDVGAQVSGQLKKLHVDIGDTVKKGDLIAEIDPRLYDAQAKADEAALKTLQAQLEQQKAQIKLSQQQFDRNTRLYKSQAISQDTLQTSEASLIVAKAQQKSIQAQMEQAQSKLEGTMTNLEFTKIYAPMDGTVVTLTSREGQTLNANQTAPVIVQIANLDTMTTRAQVAEADILNLKPDMEVYFTILGNQERKWQGKIRQLQPSPEIVNEVVLYNVLIDVDNTDHQLMTGMTTQMFFVQGSAKDAVLIPLAALIRAVPEQNSDKGDAYIVHIPQGKKYIEKTVYTGLSNRTQIEIREGLADGDKVIIPAANDAQKSGMPRFAPGPRL